MDSKFKPIAKIKKQLMDKVESELIHARFEKQNIQNKIDSLYEDMTKAVPPESGTISLMRLFQENLKLLRREKDDYVHALKYMQNEILRLQNEYKKANMEYEKIKYLEEQEIAEKIKKIKRQESINMDEIANMLFSNQKGM